MNPYTNQNPVEWLRVMRELEEDFDAIFDDDKRETELSDPRYIEDFLEDEQSHCEHGNRSSDFCMGCEQERMG